MEVALYIKFPNDVKQRTADNRHGSQYIMLGTVTFRGFSPPTTASPQCLFVPHGRQKDSANMRVIITKSEAAVQHFPPCFS